MTIFSNDDPDAMDDAGLRQLLAEDEARIGDDDFTRGVMRKTRDAATWRRAALLGAGVLGGAVASASLPPLLSAAEGARWPALGLPGETRLLLEAPIGAAEITVSPLLLTGGLLAAVIALVVAASQAAREG